MKAALAATEAMIRDRLAKGPVYMRSFQRVKPIVTRMIERGELCRVAPRGSDAGGGLTGVFLDPPYSSGEHAIEYAAGQSCVASDVRRWCAENGDNPALRIVLAGYDGEHNELESMGWRAVAWKARGGYGSQGEGRGRANASRERLWLSPHCMGVAPDLFNAIEAAA